MSKQIFTRKIGNIFGRAIFAGYVLIFIGLAVFIFSALFEAYRSHFYIGGIIGFLIVLLGLLFSFSYYGVDVDFERKKIRNFKVYIGVKVGGWHNMPNYESVVVERVDPENPSSFEGITPAVRWYKIRYAVILAAGARAQLVSVKPNADTAHADAQILASKLNLDIIDYVDAKA